MRSSRKRRFNWAICLCYALAALLFLLLQLFALNHIRLMQVVPFLLPLLPAVLAVYEGYSFGGCGAVVIGFFADLLLSSSPVPGFYTLTLALVALIAALLPKYWLPSGFFCSFIAGALSYLFLAIGRLIVGFFQGIPLLPLLSIAAKELLLSLPFVIPVNFLFRRIHRYFYPE